MDLTSWEPLIVVGGTLGGTVVGSLFTLFAQRQSRLQAERFARDTQLSTLRENRRNVLYAFIEAAQEVDRHVDEKVQKGTNEDLARSATHRMLFQLNCVKLLCGSTLAEAADRYAWRVHHALWGHEIPPEFPSAYEYMADERDRFMAVAVAELKPYD